MSGEAYDADVIELAKLYPLSSARSTGYPELSTALDDGVKDLLHDSLVITDNLNPLYVEDLLRDCVRRIDNCLDIRDRAQEIEIRAVTEALNFRLQSAALELQQKSLEVFGVEYGKLAQNAVSAEISGASVKFVGLAPAKWLELTTKQGAINEAALASLNTRRAKAAKNGNGSNFVERFGFLKRLFDQQIVEAYRRSRVAERALAAIYGISDAKLPKPSATGFLNELALWVQKASDSLDLELDKRYLGNALFSIAAPDESPKDYMLIARKAFNTMLTTGRIEFTLNSSHFERLGMRDVLLRSVRLQVQGIDDKKQMLWQPVATLPQDRVTGAVQKFAVPMPSTYQDLPATESIVRGVHNIDPKGPWSVSLDSKALTGEPTSSVSIKNVLLMLRVSYKA